MKEQRCVIAPTYLITRDICETLEGKLGVNLNERLKKGIKQMEAEFLRGFWQYVPGAFVRCAAVEAEELRQDIQQSTKQSRFPVVSLDRTYIPEAQEFLDVTRVTDPATGIVQIGERPGTEPLAEQLQKISKYNAVSLADVGAFEGGTLRSVCAALGKQGVSVEQIYLGCIGVESFEELDRTTATRLYNFYEWIEMKDLFGIDGRKVAGPERRFIPYWENLTEWASIPEQNVQDVKALCKESNSKLMDLLTRERLDTERIGEAIAYGGENENTNRSYGIGSRS